MSYEEKRVRVKTYGTLPRDSKLLVPVPGVGGKARHLHTLAAKALATLSEAVERDLGLELKLASAWRKHKWTSYEQYEKTIIARFGSAKEGRKWLAYSSPHETGLAIDIGVGGLWPTRKTAKEQKEQPLHKWMIAHAHEHGWHPYKVEPWHWEHPLSLEAYQSGVIGESDPGPPEDDVSFGVGELEDEFMEDVEAFEDDDEDFAPPET